VAGTLDEYTTLAITVLTFRFLTLRGAQGQCRLSVRIEPYIGLSSLLD